MDKYIVSGHESFSLREGWILKGIHYYENDNNLFASAKLKDAIDNLGIGSNMVKSLKYWFDVYGIITNNTINPYIKELLKYDEYLQNYNSLWLLHFLSLDSQRNSRVLLWDILFKQYNFSVFSKEHLYDFIKVKLSEDESLKQYSKKTLEDSIVVLIKTYLYEINEQDPENNIISPFSKLKYLLKNFNGDYYFRNINYYEISPFLFYFILLKIFKNNNKCEFKEFYNEFETYIKMEIIDVEHLLKVLENKNLITIDRAAGLNNIILKNDIKIIDTNKIIEKIFTESEV